MGHNNIPLSSTQLVQAAEQLSPEELERFADEVAALRARRKAPLLTPDESTLFALINRSLAEADRRRLEELGRQRSDETLTPDEHRELLTLQQRLEARHVDRMRALAQLAELRGVTLTTVMDQLGIQFPDHP